MSQKWQRSNRHVGSWMTSDVQTNWIVPRELTEREENELRFQVRYFAKYEVSSSFLLETEYIKTRIHENISIFIRIPYLLNPICSFHFGDSSGINLPLLLKLSRGKRAWDTSVTYVLHLRILPFVREIDTNDTLDIAYLADFATLARHL